MVGAAMSALNFAPFRAAIVLLLAVFPLSAQEAPPEKVQKHYEMLLKRPASGYLFDRFVNVWLDTATLEDLGKFLTAKVAAGGKTEDHLLLAFFHARQGDSAKAIAQFRIALEKDPGSAEAGFQKAVVEARTLNFDTALADLEKAAAAKPRPELELEIRQLQARLLIRSGQPAKAGEVLRALLARHPDDELLREDLIELEVAEGLMDEAAAATGELIALTKDPQKKILRRLRLGDIRQRAGKREEAVDIYAASLAEVGAESWLEKEILSQIEQVYRREDDLSGLRDRWQRMVAAEPRRIALRLAQARLLTSDGQAEPALAAWREILQLTPGNRAIRETYMDQLVVLKKLPEAIAQLEELIARHTTDLELLARLADMQFQNKDTAKCRAALEKFVEKSDRSEGVWLRVAALMERYGMGAEALVTLEKAAAAHPQSEAVAEAQAITLHGLDRKPEAVAVWKKLAAGKDRARTVQVARLAAARDEPQAAFDILHDRLTDFENDPLFLGELTAAAVRVKREAEALPWARRRLTLTTASADFEPALDDAVRIVTALEREQEVIREITSGANPSPQDLSLAAALQESVGNPKSAEELLAKVAATMPELGGALRVRLFVTRGELLKAADAMKKVIELPDGRRTAAVQRMVDLYQRAGRLDDALTWTAEWKRLSPGSAAPWETEARLLMLLGRTADSLKTLRQAAQQFADNDDLKAGLARRYRDEGKLADAQRILEQLYEDGKDPGQKLKWVGELAATAELQGRTRELIESFEERRRNNRASTLPLLALSEIYRTADNYEDRRAALLEAARLKPDDIDLLMEIARIEQSQGDLARAQETLRKAKTLDKSNRATQKLAEVLFESGRDEDALKMMQEIDTAKRLDPKAVESLALSVISSGEWERAEAFLRPLLPKYPDNYRLHYLRALTLEETGQNSAAQEAFLRVMDMAKELPGARPSKQREQLAKLHTHLPDAAVQIVDAMQSQGYAYMHRQQRSGNSYITTTANGVRTVVSSGSGGALKVTLPSDLEENRTLSLLHLAGLGQGMEEPALAALQRELSGRGIVWARHLVDITRQSSYRSDSISPQVSAVVQAAPTEDYALALLCYQFSYTPAGRWAPQLRAAFATFRERHPQLAAMAALALLRHDDPADLPLLKEAAAVIGKIEQPIDVLSYSLANVTWMASERGGPVKPERREIARVISEKLEALYSALPDNSPARQQLQYSILQACMNRNDWTRMMRLLQDELTAAQNAQGQVSRNSSNYYGGQNSFIVEPAFPPQRLPQFPASVSQRWGLDGNGGGISLFVPAGEEGKCRAAIRAAQEPSLRILCAVKLGDEALIDEMIRAAATAPEPGAAVCAILAGRHASRGEPDKALEWLRRTQFLPLTRDDRAVIDRYLLGVITLGGLNPAPDSPDFIAARDAAVRLRQTKLDNQKRDELSRSLTALGLIEDAEKLLAANVTATRPPSSVSAAAMQAQTPDAKIEQLFKQGRKDKALALIQRELRSAARSSTSGGYYRDISGIVRVTNKLNLKAEVMKSMEPPAGATAALAEFGWLCTLFEDRDAARQWYEKAVAARPADFRVRFVAAAMILNGEKPDVEAAWKLLADLPAEAVADSADSVRNLVEGNSLMENRMAALEILRRLLEKHRAAKNLTWGWALNALDGAMRNASVGDTQLPSIYAKPSPKAPSLTRAAKLGEWEDKRRRIHDAICVLMADVPALRGEAFARLASLRLFENKAGDDLMALARQALLTKPDSAAGLNAGRTYYGDEGSQQIPRPGPLDYLTETAWKRNDRAILDQTAAELESQERPDEAKSLRAHADLYFCPEADFESRARSEVLAAKPEERSVQDDVVIRIWEKRKLPPVLTALLLEKLQLPGQRENVYTPLKNIAQYLAGLVGSDRRKEADALCAEVCTLLLAPPDKRAEWIRANFNPRTYSPPNTKGAVIRSVVQFFQEAARRDETTIIALTGLHDQLFQYSEELRTDQYGSGYNPGILNDWLATIPPERMKVILDGSPLLSDLPEWRPVPNPQPADSTALAAILKSTARPNVTPSARKGFLTLLNTYPATLGRDIFLAAVQAEKDDTMRREVLGVLAGHRDAMAALPPARLREIASMAKELQGDDAAKLKLPPATNAFLEWLKTHEGSTDELAVFLKPAEKWEKPAESWAWQQKVRKAMRLAAKESREKFHAVVARARQSRVQGLPSAVSPQPKQENSPLALALLSHLQETAVERRKLSDPAFWTSLVYVAEAILDPANDVDCDTTGIDAQTKNAFVMLWRDCLKDRSTPDALTEFTARLNAVFPPDAVRLYTQGLVQALLPDDRNKIPQDEITAWLASPGAKSNPVALELAMFLDALTKHRGATATAAGPGGPDACEQHLLSVAHNEKLSLKARLTMTAAWLNHAHRAFSPAAVKEVAGMLTALWQTRRSYDVSDAEGVFTAVLALPDAAQRQEILKPLLAATLKVPCIHMGPTLDEQLVSAAVQCDDKALLERVAGGRGAVMHHGYLAAMLREGAQDEARRWFEQHALAIGTKTGPDYARWSPELAEKGAAFVKSLDAPHKAYLAEVLIALLPGGEDEAARRKNIRERLTPLAKKFGSVALPDAAWRDRIIDLIASDSEAIKEAAAFFGPMAEKDTLAVIARTGGGSLTSKLTVLRLWIIHEFKERRFGPLEQFLTEMNVRRNYGYSSSNAVDPWQKNLQETIQGTLHTAFMFSHEWTAEERSKLSEIYFAFLRQKSLITDSQESEEVIQAALLYHAISGQNEALAAWWNAQPEDLRKKIQDRFGNSTIELWLSKEDMETRFGADRTARLNFVREYLANPVGLTGGEQSMERPVGLEWTTREEILEMSGGLLARVPRGGETAIQLAGVAEKARAWDRAAAIFETAAQQLEKDDPKKMRVRLLLLRVFMLLEAGKADESLTETDKLRPLVLDALKSGKVETEALRGLATWIDARGRALLAAGRKDEALAFLGVNPAVQRLAVREAGGNLSDSAIHEAIFRYAEAKTGVKVLRLVPKESVWKYRDSVAAPPATWNTPAFDDNQWPSGKGRLGYGDPVATPLTFGPDPKNKTMACYFRASFDLANPAEAQSLQLDVQRDDGCVVYLNGNEILRQNMPDGPVGHDTPSASRVDAALETEYFPARLTTEHLVTGRNVLAVEVHQSEPISSDLTFDLQLRGNLPDPNEILRTLDVNELGPKLGELWTMLPDALKKAME